MTPVNMRIDHDTNAALQTDSLNTPISTADYLFRRLHQLGARAVHGVKGEHNYAAIEHVESSGLTWVEYCTELSAGYAADGYARIKGVSALMTTFGSGELCAFNAIAAAHVECVPIVHIVGTPPKGTSSNSRLYCSLGDGDNSTFTDLYRPVTQVCTILHNPAEIANQIDHALRECWTQSRPVYIGLPVDTVEYLIEGEHLRTPIDLSFPPNDPDKETYVAEVVWRYLNAASNPVVLVDAGAIRHKVLEEVHELIIRSNVATFVSPMAKGAVDETLPNFCGTYAGSASDEVVREQVESADLVLSIGALKSDFVNQSGLTYMTSGLPTIYLHHDRVCVRYSEYHDVRMGGVLSRIAQGLKSHSPRNDLDPAGRHLFPPRDASLRTTHDTITHLWFWHTFSRWLQPLDAVLADAGIPAYGLWGIKFPSQVTSITPTLWCSRGYGLPACQGTALAISELTRSFLFRSSPADAEWRSKPPRPRTILLTTPESLQTYASEISTIIRHRLKPIIFVLCPAHSSPQERPQASRPSKDPEAETLGPTPLSRNGSGNTALNWGSRKKKPGLVGHPPNPMLPPPQPESNAAVSWRYRDLFSAVGAPRDAYQFCSAVRTRKQLTTLLNTDALSNNSAMQVVQLEFGVAGDEPAALGRATKAYSSTNKWTRRPGDA